jgi:cyclophilin family peptidyl-prolyl cis-trans isomerase
MNSTFHRVIKGFVLQGGDFVNHDGEFAERKKGNELVLCSCLLTKKYPSLQIRSFFLLGTGKLSIYGPTFPDENLTTHKHDKAGMVRDEKESFLYIMPCGSHG